MSRTVKAGKAKGPESLLFVAGHPVSHSLSPSMHNAVIKRLGLPLRYIGVDVPPALLADFLRVVKAGNFLGGNITIPHKQEAAAIADERSEAVELCGAANVILVRNGKLIADNTDGVGLIDSAVHAGWGKKFRNVVILGAGGAARGIALELCRIGSTRITILNRNISRAEELASILSARFPGTNLGAGGLKKPEMIKKFPGADLIIQCTSVGLNEEWKDFPYEAIEKSTRFADIIYRKGETRLVRDLKKRGISAIDGLTMLACQAARSFYIWTGKRVPAEDFLSAARKTFSTL